MDISRRQFIKSAAVQSAVAAAAVLFPGVSFGAWKNLDPASGGIEWKKTPCRFCGTGCGLLVGVSGERAVAVKGDPNCSVNKGLCCIKGYHSIQILYAKDRITKALVRKNGKLVETPLKEALDLVASKMQETIKSNGKDAVAMYGSGQWSITDGYVASKLFKGCIGTNNVEANARLCMASAVTGFLTSFGLDEPMGCYEDMDHADVFITWGNNMAEMHPVLFSRMLANRKSKRHVKIIDFATRATRTSQAADKSILFKPQTDLAVANAICYEIIRNDWVNWDFVNKHVSFHKGKTNIGYGTEDHFNFKDKPETVDFEAYKEFLEDYTPEKVEKISGVPARDIKYLASLFGDPDKKVTSFWCMGMNQHTNSRQQPLFVDRSAERLRYGARSGHPDPQTSPRPRREGRGPQDGRQNLERAGGKHRSQAHLPHRGDVPGAGPGGYPLHVGSGNQSHGHHAQFESLSQRR
jgi:nitrate reductase NapA